MDTVARSWTLAWGFFINREVPDELPEAYLRERRKYGATGIGQMTLKDPEPAEIPDQTEPMRNLEGTLNFLRERGII
jgi:hypothetical protein